MSTGYYCVILAGGQGSRFWPYSRRSFPKQFLDFGGSGESLLQRTYRRFRRDFDPDHIFISTNISYLDLVATQLPDLPLRNVLAEPGVRNTAAAIAYATMHIRALDEEATVVYAPSDHLVQKSDIFNDAIRRALDEAKRCGKIVTLGIRPTRPETGYGYIQVSGGVDEDRSLPMEQRKFYPVKTFTEKPNKEMAKVLVESGEFFWNSGLFISSVVRMKRAFEEYMPETAERLMSRPEVYGTPQERAFINENYPYCPSLSFDYGVMEKIDSVTMLLCDVGWADLGTWSAIYNLGEKDENLNFSRGTKTVFLESESNLVVADDPEMLVAMQGVNDMILVKKENVIMLCRRGDEQKLKQLLLEASSIGDGYVD